MLDALGHGIPSVVDNPRSGQGDEAGKPAAEAAKDKDEVPKKKAKNEAGKKVEVAFR